MIISKMQLLQLMDIAKIFLSQDADTPFTIGKDHRDMIGNLLNMIYVQNNDQMIEVKDEINAAH